MCISEVNKIIDEYGENGILSYSKLVKILRNKREGYAEFFERHSSNARRCRRCENCGARLRGHYSEVAHILNKQKFKSVATDDDNVLYLGSAFVSNCNCHDEFDNCRIEKLVKMPCFPKAVEKFKLLRERITERPALGDKRYWAYDDYANMEGD